VWPELKEQLEVEQAQLRQLFEVHRPLLEKCRSQEPNAIELSALGAFLHSFYTGVENLFRRVTLELGGRMPQGEAWHQRMLQEMMQADERRPAFISAELGEQLKIYLGFRHVFRQAYSFQLHWEKMAPLTHSLEETFVRLQSEIAVFVSRMNES
jgi:hypothetical protein